MSYMYDLSKFSEEIRVAMAVVARLASISLPKDAISSSHREMLGELPNLIAFGVHFSEEDKKVYQLIERKMINEELYRESLTKYHFPTELEWNGIRC